MIMFIVNKRHTFAKVVQWADYAAAGIAEYYYEKNQLWHFQTDRNNHDFYFIESVLYPGYRITKWCYKDEEVGVFNGKFNENQQWWLTRVEDNLGIEWDYYM